MLIFLADKLAPTASEALSEAGHTVVEEPALSGDALIEALAQHKPDVLIVRSTKVPKAALAASSRLELVIRAGAGYDNVDVASASGLGIFVANCPGKNAVAVAELTWGLILAMDRRIPDNVLDARAGHWRKSTYAKAAGLKGRTLGVIGTGNIGQAVIRRAQAFGLNVVAWSRSLTDEGARALDVCRCESPEEVARFSDIVSLHVAATPETKHLANRAFFEAMRDGAFFVNTTRGSVVDEDALRWALEHKTIRAGLDVFDGEPAYKDGDLDHPLARHPQVYLTHHIGASTQQAQEAIADEAVRVALTYATTGKVPNCVNLAVRTPATYQLTVRHLDKVGVLAAVLDELRKANWNVQEMDNLIFEGAEAACARIRFVGEPTDTVVDRVSEHEDVLAVTLLPI